tara:strand:+ start:39 stop:1970 length:1932 start_codon:yes stop_codon:yes gene_type:complete
MRKILLLLPFFLWTCGGGGGSTEPEPPQLPTVTNIEVITLEDTAKTFALTGTDPNNLALTYSISTQPQHGTISISGGAATYSPNANYHGQDVIAYLASSTNGNSNIGTIIITITPVDDEPNTMDVTATTDEDNSVTLTLEAEEYDGENIEFQVRNNPSNGSVAISGTTATYTPNQDFNGTDTFNFEAVDSSNRSVLNVATATITVNPINDAPKVNDIYYSDSYVYINESINIPLSGEDVDNDNLTYTIVEQPSKGTVTVNGNVATFTGSAGGDDSFTFKANDGQVDSNVASVFLDILFNDIFFGSASNSEKVYEVKKVSDGNVVLAGRTGSIAFIAKVTLDAEVLWYKEIEITGTASDCSGQFLSDFEETLNGNLIFVGSCSTRLAVVVTDSNGNLISSKKYDNWGNGRAIFPIINNQYIIHSSDFSNGSGGNDALLLTIDDNGNEIDNSSGSYIAYGYAFADDDNKTSIKLSDNEFIIMHVADNNSWEYRLFDSSYNTSLYGSHSDQFAHKNHRRDLISSSSAPFYYIGTYENNLGVNIKKVNTYNITNTSIFEYRGAVETSDDGLLIAGSLGNNIKFHKYDSSGNDLSWDKGIYNRDINFEIGIIEDNDGSFLLITADGNPNTLSTDIFLFKLDSSGNRIK